MPVYHMGPHQCLCSCLYFTFKNIKNIILPLALIYVFKWQEFFIAVIISVSFPLRWNWYFEILDIMSTCT